MNINLSKLEIEVAIGEFRTVDARKELGNVLFAKATTLEQDELSRKIFNSPEDGITLSDSEYESMLNELQSSGVRYSVVNAIKDSVKDCITEKDV
ncbi:hypothetical protein [Tannerella forsythia]|uniref:hypothetical protein n=1 Tax=Tannerella forsythia TaxID=28112 RepID=UPI0028E943DD|nr:hypothetical protein [Tannerella forsythia]